jgi:hypothetical protein
MDPVQSLLLDVTKVILIGLLGSILGILKTDPKQKPEGK